jgi:hypothetical protein
MIQQGIYVDNYAQTSKEDCISHNGSFGKHHVNRRVTANGSGVPAIITAYNHRARMLGIESYLIGYKP